MPKMGAFDAVRVHVHDDGDTELMKHELTTTLRHTYPSDLLFGVTEIHKGALDKELISYGHGPQRVKEAIDEVITSEYNNEVIV
jgi:hypothetical protein